MANVQAMPTSFKVELMNGSHAFGPQAANAVRTVTTKDVFKGALYLATASQGAATTAYNAAGELAATGNYPAGGNIITNANPPSPSGTTALWTPSAAVAFNNLTSSGIFDCLTMYNDSSTGKLAVGVFTFGPQSVTAGDFSLAMPVNAVGTALIQLA